MSRIFVAVILCAFEASSAIDQPHIDRVDPPEGPISEGAVATSSGSAYAEFLYVPPMLEELPPEYITTTAGAGLDRRFHLPATASINALGTSNDAAGNICVGSPNESRLVRIRADGVVEPCAGGGTCDVGPNGNGVQATETWMIFPRVCVYPASGGLGGYDVTATPLGSRASVTIQLTNMPLSRRRGVRR